MGDGAAMINTEEALPQPATLTPKIETSSVFKPFFPGRKASNVTLNLEGDTMRFLTSNTASWLVNEPHNDGRNQFVRPVAMYIRRSLYW